MVLADSRKISPVPRYSGYYLDKKPYMYRTVTFYGKVFQNISILVLLSVMVVLQPPGSRNYLDLG